MDTTNIIEKMMSQHRGLQKDLGSVNEELQNSKADARKINEKLKTFSKDLTKHLSLENDYFYVELIKQMKASGQNTVNTEAFIAEMSTIGELVMSFLDKYSNASMIDDQPKDFEEEFVTIVDTLNMRIEAEETGVYLYWKQRDVLKTV